jgi:hypothetical protein
MHSRYRTLAAIASYGVLLLLAACGGGSSSDLGTPPTTEPTSASSPPAVVSPIVGRWSHTNTCRELVTGLTAAGLAAAAPATLAGNGLVSGSLAQLGQKKDICAGATPLAHSHFFDAYGDFGSIDQNGQQVDDGSYRLRDPHTLFIGHTKFRIVLTKDTLRMTPVITKAAARTALAHPAKFSEAAWSVSVAYPGETWHRVACGHWC